MDSLLKQKGKVLAVRTSDLLVLLILPTLYQSLSPEGRVANLKRQLLIGGLVSILVFNSIYHVD